MASPEFYQNVRSWIATNKGKRLDNCACCLVPRTEDNFSRKSHLIPDFLLTAAVAAGNVIKRGSSTRCWGPNECKWFLFCDDCENRFCDWERAFSIVFHPIWDYVTTDPQLPLLPNLIIPEADRQDIFGFALSVLWRSALEHEEWIEFVLEHREHLLKGANPLTWPAVTINCDIVGQVDKHRHHARRRIFGPESCTFTAGHNELLLLLGPFTIYLQSPSLPSSGLMAQPPDQVIRLRWESFQHGVANTQTLKLPPSVQVGPALTLEEGVPLPFLPDRCTYDSSTRSFLLPDYFELLKTTYLPISMGGKPVRTDAATARKRSNGKQPIFLFVHIADFTGRPFSIVFEENDGVIDFSSTVNGLGAISPEDKDTLRRIAHDVMRRFV